MECDLWDQSFCRVDSTDPADIKAVNTIQDQIQVQQASAGKFEIPNWDQASQDRLRNAINILAATLTDTSKCFGTKAEVDPIAHLLGAAYGWGGSPAKDATYLNVVNSRHLKMVISTCRQHVPGFGENPDNNN